MKTAIIIGAGPAGLTAAYELVKNKEYKVIVIESEGLVGGISKTVNYKGNRIDMGGHRFFSKIPEVNDWWEKIMPTQGHVPMDDEMLNRKSTIKEGGPNPDEVYRVMLRRNRVSRILFNNKFFDYPISLKFDTIKNMGLLTTFNVGCSYLKGTIFKKKEKSLEDFYINRFGYKLYSMFFENYTKNLWGRHPRNISPDWGAQRVKGLSIKAILKDMFGKAFNIKSKHVETSLIEEFAYPKYGPGQLWECVASDFVKNGGELRLNSVVTALHTDNNKIKYIEYLDENGNKIKEQCDLVISSMPLKDLISRTNDVPCEIRNIACGLPYRDYMILGVLLDGLNLENKTKIKTINNIIPDNWIYIHSKDIKMGRIQIFNNWSPYMVKDLNNTVWIGLEYFCNEGDQMWDLTEKEFRKLAIDELIKLGIIDNTSHVIDTHMEKVKKAYPAYFDTYKDIDKLIEYLNSIENLYCIGRNGQHRYNNMDHSMCTAFEAVKNINNNISDKSNIWSVNTEKEYHEEVKS